MVILAIYYMNKNNKKTLEKFQGGVYNPLFTSTSVGRPVVVLIQLGILIIAQILYIRVSC